MYYSLDLETYGKVEGLSLQTQFHPRKSVGVDGCRRADLIQCAGLTYRAGGTPGSRDGLRSTVLPWDERGRDILRRWLEYIREVDGTLLLMNAAFDIQYLRFCDKRIRKILRPPMKIWDLSITNALNDPERPERSLKDISLILGLGAYTEKPDDRHPSKYAIDLHRYVVEDTEKTLLSQEILEERLEKRGIPISPECRAFYNDTLWSLIGMSEAGVAMNLTSLRTLDRQLTRRRETFWEACRESGLLLANKGRITGADKQKRAFMGEVFALDGMPTPALTDTGKIKISDEQVLTALTSLPRIIRYQGGAKGEICRQEYVSYLRRLKAMRFYSKLQKLQGTYVGRLLWGGKTGPHNASRHIKGVVYPSWFPVPTREKDSSGSEGGTRQMRLSARGPAIQTFPPPVKRCCTSRWKDGVLLGIDASQLELRGAALLSGDPLMMDDYERGVDRHRSTAELFVELGVISQTDLDLRPAFWRQVGKTTNFAVLYKCGASKLVELIVQATGERLPVPTMQKVISAYYEAHHRFAEWQEETIQQVIRDHEYRVPLIGLGRVFEGSPSMIREVYTNEIVNIPVQATCAAIALSAQNDLRKWLTSNGMRARIVKNVHDGIFPDCPREEVNMVRTEGVAVMERPAYYRQLCDHLGRSVPLVWDVKVLG